MVASLGLALRLFTLFIHEPTALGKKPDAPIIDPITAPLNNNKRLTSFLVFRECPGSSSGHIVFVRLFVSNDTGVSAWVVRLWCKPANKICFRAFPTRAIPANRKCTDCQKAHAATPFRTIDRATQSRGKQLASGHPDWRTLLRRSQ